MRRLFTSALCALGLFSLATTASAQIFGPTADSVSSTLWFEAGRVSIRGSNLGFVDRVTVDGVEVPILRNTGSRITIKAPATDGPGFATVEVFDSQGSDTAILSYSPTVSAARRSNRMDVTIDNGTPGSYRLAFSFDVLQSPAHTLGIKHALLLDLESASTGILASGVLTDTSRTVLRRIKVPMEPGMIGQPVFLQFMGQQGFGGGHILRAAMLTDEGIHLKAPTRSFSNLFQVPDRQATQPGN
jgi:hypothetical protein